MSDAKDWVRKDIEAGKRNGTMWDLGKSHALYAELLKRKGNLPGAKENLNKAIVLGTGDLSEIGRQIIRGVLGGILGGSRRR